MIDFVSGVGGLSRCSDYCQQTFGCEWLSYEKDTDLCVMFEDCSNLIESEDNFISSQVICGPPPKSKFHQYSRLANL